MLISIVFSCVPEFYYCTTNSPNNNSFLLYLKNLENSSAPSGINRGHLVVFSWQMVQRVLESFITCMVPWEHLRALTRDSTRGFCSTTVSELSNILRGSTGLWKECSKEPQWQLQGFFPILEVSEHQFHQVLVSIGHWEQPRFKRRKIRTHLFMRGIAKSLWPSLIYPTLSNLPTFTESFRIAGLTLWCLTVDSLPEALGRSFTIFSWLLLRSSFQAAVWEFACLDKFHWAPVILFGWETVKNLSSFSNSLFKAVEFHASP